MKPYRDERERLAKTQRVRKLLQWCMDKGQEDRRLDLGCSCGERTNLMASTALTAWLEPFHSQAPHLPWVRNPFAQSKGKPHA